MDAYSNDFVDKFKQSQKENIEQSGMRSSLEPLSSWYETNRTFNHSKPSLPTSGKAIGGHDFA